jgi:hypothetical protein
LRERAFDVGDMLEEEVTGGLEGLFKGRGPGVKNRVGI